MMGCAGLKSQHVTAIEWLAQATGASVEGLQVGSKTLTFAPTLGPAELRGHVFKIQAESSAASALLMFQAVLPFILFSGGNEPVQLQICGGTNTSFSLTFEYLDQVLLPALEERFGIIVAERSLESRGWSVGQPTRGEINLKIQPLPRGEKLRFLPPPPRSKQPADGDDSDGDLPTDVKDIDVNLVLPERYHEQMRNQLFKDLTAMYPTASINFKMVEDSRQDVRWYILVVAKCDDGAIRIAEDDLCSLPKKTNQHATFVQSRSRDVCRALYNQTFHDGEVDRHLEDQVIIYQAISDGYSAFRGDIPLAQNGSGDQQNLTGAMKKLSVGEGMKMRRDKGVEPFGYGSLHAQTARWVVGELLPAVEFYNGGALVKGVGLNFPAGAE